MGRETCPGPNKGREGGKKKGVTTDVLFTSIMALISSEGILMRNQTGGSLRAELYLVV